MRDLREVGLLVGLLALDAGCQRSSPTALVTQTVRGASMTGLLEPGQKIRVRVGHYEGHAVERGDIVIYGRERPLVKSVRGVPGDEFAVAESPGKRQLLINGKVATTSRGEPYSLDGASGRMLSLYQRDYRGRIPEDAYLILGNTPTGSHDSTRFGLVARRDLVGKVIR